MLIDSFWSDAARFVLSALVAVAVLPVVARVLRAAGLERTNYEGKGIVTGAGALFALLAPVSLLTLQVGGRVGLDPSPAALAALAAAFGFGLLGFIDDRWGTPEHKGLRGHVGALRRGRVTTGLLKAVGGAALALGLAWVHDRGPSCVPATLIIAMTANAFNLLDLRPLRALKAFWLLGCAFVWSGPPLLLTLLGATVPYAAHESRRSVMLGDTGSNLLGGVVGLIAAYSLPLWGQAVMLIALAAFHLWTERHSLSAWIEDHAWARAIDRWGWGRDELT